MAIFGLPQFFKSEFLQRLKFKLFFMKINLSKGVLEIDTKKVQLVIFKDGTTMSFPVQETSTISVESGAGNNDVDVKGDKNAVVSGSKNVIIGGSIKCGGSFRLGDG